MFLSLYLEHPSSYIGFHCKVDDPEKDVISFTIFRYALPWLDFRSSVTIESFSSQNNVWTTIDLTLDVPLRIPLSSWRKVTSAGVIDGVFCWIDEESQIILYDSVDRCFWALQLTQEMKAAGDCYLGVSGGALYYASCVAAKITVWCLESTIRKYAANLTYTLVKYCSSC
ncbi:hypothetical protein FXO38_35742 [Capsicum annuum]|nr:hypothetical protein FXO38_35742 [Capsicum annuum]KAF3624411.1 hypothetical protein FXO37_31356 [Capsicum annuum]